MSSRLVPIFLAFLMIVDRANALGLPDPSVLSNPDALGLGGLPNEAIKTVGIAFDNRAYQPATPLGTSGVDLSVEATAVRVPDSFKAALVQAGFGDASQIPILPSPKLSLHKGLSDRTDIGGSLIALRDYMVVGGDIKVTLNDPELEGPTFALRLSYNYAKLGFVIAHTYSPQILMSRKMEFADPYIGLGYQYARGSVQYNFETSIPGVVVPLGPFAGAGGGAVAFLGVGLRPPHIGLKLTIEGSYSTIQAHALGLKFGFSF
jgi:hypothetical protein